MKIGRRGSRTCPAMEWMGKAYKEEQKKLRELTTKVVERKAPWPTGEIEKSSKARQGRTCL